MLAPRRNAPCWIARVASQKTQAEMRAFRVLAASVRDVGLAATLGQLPGRLLAPVTLRRLKRRKGVQFQRKLRESVKLWEAGLLDSDSLVASIEAWVNHVRYGNTGGLIKTVLGGLPSELLAMMGSSINKFVGQGNIFAKH